MKQFLERIWPKRYLAPGLNNTGKYNMRSRAPRVSACGTYSSTRKPLHDNQRTEHKKYFLKRFSYSLNTQGRIQMLITNLDQYMCDVIIAGHILLSQVLNEKPIFGIILYLKCMNYC